ncbi:tRNA (guanine-N1)-methyltransferase [Candidatus Arthromitus sp. SFB-mouse-Japan]|uniref:tRNA (guanosine(37)-N1)-methyltransferase TrmD n=1 Tax=Candidatus Arthromitus sp. SFB-mouse TaxID=49118 RepID=UPI00021B8069|nr:tRNA (guanosine(37)-N1)-methyltransferase TrmD [Candidatus Arthromitus sp. SFB-mouse]EIA21898.1 tRNA (guanine-N(1)-)-methyltransferase [Candidatus Arthromitus sp. SFB-2]EIA26393.1 tRNA (guanine-N(1)-)-methyltransferase [Candidatus Arthromitus sp. SFB-4]EIA26734.1 tRNA (guanine-N(1)-)-methyltransferase [Candidatus Arthromitus sp. SFB-5]EIA26775.1 tRNA (guanine-N(1)-)-methyltransferase [Candidatus Arthromitus sp. SFB-3]EIA28614.1 tRNA (guanine-N(1)-)-methyltransferase [Candidatus Arthromitus 
MKISILSLFPQMFEVFNHSIVGKARMNNYVDIEIINIRDFSNNKHNKVDDYPFGGGAGMLMSVEPIYNSICYARRNLDGRVIYLGPRGDTFNQNKAYELSDNNHLIFLCGHYEGIDERSYNFIDEEISLGDFILTGGEMAAIPIIDSIVRLLSGVINKNSLDNESFTNDLMDFPQYTRPREFMGISVPNVLLSGNHKEIDKWRREESLKITRKYKRYLLKDK